jgi:UDP-N-acetylglucosamine--N-acetylmuramyl-(pentapeptide) pyrophosphoryl-undecaprenol N-acetylglucosamine transferase
VTRAEASLGPPYALITGGGTGGHVYPALAVADELVHRGHARASVRFVGSRRGIEATAVPDAGYRIELLPGRGLRRSARPSALLANVCAVAGLARAFVRALRLVARPRPRVVFGVGGYASAACLVAARLRRVPAVVHEQNAAPGLANRIAVRLGASAAVSFPDTPLRGAVLTGNPVRREIVDITREPRVSAPLVVVVGGSLGARTLNDAARGLCERWRTRADVAVRHVTGRRDFERVRDMLQSSRAPSDTLDYELLAYDDDMAAAYSSASLFVCRAGAITCAELTVTGTPAILVPLPGAPADHQARNASALARAGAAIVVPDDELDGDRLAREIDELLGDPDRLRQMGLAARALGRPDAVDRVARLVEDTARASSPDRPS